MKRLFVYLLPLALLVSACSKEKSLEFSPDPNNPNNPGGGGGGGSATGYFLKCKIAGAAKTFNVGTMAMRQSVGGATAVIALGKANQNPNDTEAFTFTVSFNIPPAPGTYAVDDLSMDFAVAGTWVTSNPNIQCLALQGDQSPNPFKVVITSINNTEMAGTFSGNMFEINISNPSPNPAVKAVTEGEFKVKFQ